MTRACSWCNNDVHENDDVNGYHDGCYWELQEWRDVMDVTPTN